MSNAYALIFQCNIKKIRQVYAPPMYGMYLLHKEESRMQGVQEKLLFHVTTESSAMESLETGLDWRRTQRAKFGCGVSFSDDADYANYYANSSPYQGMTTNNNVCYRRLNNTHRRTDHIHWKIVVKIFGWLLNPRLIYTHVPSKIIGLLSFFVTVHYKYLPKSLFYSFIEHQCIITFYLKVS